VRLLLDECVEFGLAKMLRASGHDVVLMQDVEPGADDGRVLELAAAQDRLLVTVDKDFGDLALRRRRPVPGVVLVRIPIEQRHVVGRRLASVLDDFGDRLIGHHTVVQAAKLRIRRLRLDR